VKQVGTLEDGYVNNANCIYVNRDKMSKTIGGNVMIKKTHKFCAALGSAFLVTLLAFTLTACDNDSESTDDLTTAEENQPTVTATPQPTPQQVAGATPPTDSPSDARQRPDYVIILGQQISTDATEVSFMFDVLLDEDAASLAYLTELTSLNLHSSQLTDISFLSGMSNLQFLNLHDSRIADFAPLAALTNLTNLSISFDQNTDFTPISGLSNLEFLSLNGAWSEIAVLPPSLAYLAGLTNLTHFSIELLGNQLTELSPIGTLSNLTELNATNNAIADLSTFAGANMPNLWRLSLVMNFIRDLSPLAQAYFPNLTDLTLDDNVISDVTPLAHFTSLHVLRIPNNPIGDISALGGLTNLAALIINNTAVSDISAVRGMTNLFSLLADDNYISDLSPLEGIQSIRTLGLQNNLISDISALASLTDLHSLDARYNMITDLSPLANLHGWGPSDLRLYDNPITDWSPVDHVDWVFGRP